MPILLLALCIACALIAPRAAANTTTVAMAVDVGALPCFNRSCDLPWAHPGYREVEMRGNGRSTLLMF